MPDPQPLARPVAPSEGKARLLAAVLAQLGVPDRDLERIKASGTGARSVYVGTLSDHAVKILISRLTGRQDHRGSLAAALRKTLLAVGFHDYETAKITDRTNLSTRERFVHVGSISFASVDVLCVRLTETQAVCHWCTESPSSLIPVRQASGPVTAHACARCIELYDLLAPDSQHIDRPRLVVGPNGPMRRPIPGDPSDRPRPLT